MPYIRRQSLRVSLAAGWLATALLIAPGVHAQAISPDFVSDVQSTLPSNEQLVGQIQDTPTDNLAAISDQTDLTLSTSDSLMQQLTSALSLAPDDAARSRLQGVLLHTQAATASLRQAQTETTLDAARGRLGQALGEAQEALTELRPFALGLPMVGK